MGSRGPQKGFKQARAAAAAAAAAAAPAAAPSTPWPGLGPPVPLVAIPPVLSAHDRENPERLAGDALKELAHRRGLSRSELATMPDEKIRQQLRIRHAQRVDEATAIDT